MKPRIHHMKATVCFSVLLNHYSQSGPVCDAVKVNCALVCVLFVGQGEWDNSWSGAGGKVPPTRQSKGSYREHPYVRYWTTTGRELLWQLSPDCNRLNFSKSNFPSCLFPLFLRFILCLCFFKLRDILLDVPEYQIRNTRSRGVFFSIVYLFPFKCFSCVVRN